MHKKLTKSPLTYVLAQIKFREILGMKEYIPALQEAIRSEFSEYNEQKITAIDLVNAKTKTANTWHFLDETFTTDIIVATDSIVIHTSKYVSFEAMIDKIKEVLTKFNEIIKNKLYSRIGLRYVNLIHTDITNALEPGLLGYPLKDEDIFENTYLARSETIQKTKSGTIKVNSMHISDKSIMNSGNLYIPPDLSQGTDFLSFEHHKDKNPAKEYVILDIDHFTTGVGNEFTPQKIVEQLNNLHEGSFEAFRKSITKETWKKWE